MLVVPLLEIVGGSLILFVLAVPLGLVVLDLAEWWRSKPLVLTRLERILFAFYATGGVLFVLASIAVGFYGAPLVVGALSVGWVVKLARWARSRWQEPRRFLAWARTPTAAVIALGTLGVLVWEALYVANIPLGNGVDGAVHALFVQLLLTQHALPWTLQPYANVGVTYPQGAPVWESLPPLLFSWPVTASPVALPPLFLSFTVPTTYCLGERWAPSRYRRSLTGGLLYAAFFGLLASWPRMVVGGSYDFAFAFPLMILIVALLPAFFSRRDRSLRDAVLLGGGIGCAAVISGSIGLAFAALLPVFWLLFSPQGVRPRLAGALNIVLALLVGVSAEIRSFAGVIAWYSYPAHVLGPVGLPPYANPAVPNPLSYRNVTGELDPFILWKYAMSPVPGQSLFLEILLAAGLVVLAIRFGDHLGRLGSLVSAGEARSTAGGVIALFALTALVLLGAAANTSPSGIPSVVNPDELAQILFFFFQTVALLPLLIVARFSLRAWGDWAAHRTSVVRHSLSSPPLAGRARRIRGPRVVGPQYTAVLAAATVIVSLLAGSATTVILVPGAIMHQVDSQANISSGDIAALRWAGANLPHCSTVLVAPGSAAQFLPEFALVHIDFPSYPPAYNGSYWIAVNGLTAGTYNASVRSALSALGITEVFVTGRTTPEFGALSPVPMEGSTDFALLFHDGDAFVFAFTVGEAGTSCVP